jgi:hypothetical protein
VLFADGFLGFLLIGLWVFCIFDVLTTPEPLVKHLPKMMWLIIVLILPDIGSIIWLVAGRERNVSRGKAPVRPAASPEYDRPGHATATSPDDDEAFLRQLRDRAEQQRRAHETKRAADLQAEQERLRRRPEQG